MTKVIAFSAKKNGGKTTSASFVYASTLCSLGIIKAFRFTEDGKLEVLHEVEVDGQIQQQCGELDPADPENEDFLGSIYVEEYEKTADKFVKVYSFADDLKQKVCIDILGLTRGQCYGTEEEKNSLTKFKWEDMPGILPEPMWQEKGWSGCTCCGTPHRKGIMTAREVMQYVGTEIFRKMYSKVWAESTLRRIQEEGVDIALLADLRFPEEMELVQQHGGKVIRLLRSPFADSHESEVALDSCESFDYVFDNSDTTIKETNSYLEEYLRSIGWFPEYLLGVKKQ